MISVPTTPVAIDQRTREETVTLTALRDVIPATCFRPRPIRSWLALARVAATVLLCLWALSAIPVRPGAELLWEFPAMMAVWLVYGWALTGLFFIGHDCGHYSFSPRRWVNTLVGHIALSPLANGFHAWKLSHNHHHAHTLLRGQEVDWASRLVTRQEYESGRKQPWLTRLGYAMPFGVGLWIGWNMFVRGLAMRRMIDPSVYARERGRILASNAVMIAVVLGIYAGLWNAFGLWGMLKFYSIPATIAAITGTFIITIQHANRDSLIYDREGWTPFRAQMVSTFDVRFPRLMERLWFDVNIHIPHHLAPSIPWYSLKPAAERLRAAFPQWYLEQPFSWDHLAWWRRTPFLKKDEEKGYYSLEQRPPTTAPAVRTRWISRGVVIASGLVAMGTLFIAPGSPAGWLADILVRTYAIFVGTVMAHEAVHGHLGRGRTGNVWWGTIALLPSMVPFGNFRKTHLLHHAHTNIPDQDPDHFIRHRHAIEIPFRALAMPHQWLFWLWRRGRVNRTHIANLVVNYAAIFALFGGVAAIVGLSRVLWGMTPALVLVSILLWHPFAFKTHEGFSTGANELRSHNYYGRFLYWFSFGLSVHRTHHLKPRLAWVELRRFVQADPQRGFLRRIFARRDGRVTGDAV